MSQLIFKFGALAGVINIAVFGSMFIFGKHVDFSTAEMLGYTTMIASLLMVFFGMKREIDEKPSLTYWQNVKTGIGISAVAALVFGAFNFILHQWLDPNFMNRLREHYTASIQQSNLPPEKIAAQLKEVEMMSTGIYANPLFQAFIMGMTVLVIGILIAFISGALLRKRAKIKLA